MPQIDNMCPVVWLKQINVIISGWKYAWNVSQFHRTNITFQSQSGLVVVLLTSTHDTAATHYLH